ncbi:MAG: putative membrane protein YphA (DoxX/SURF4 family) [Arcticibacterium sp.]|jgi:uncharacterized membrane protein YphA (DoxX/SURF4 family)
MGFISIKELFDFWNQLLFSQQSTLTISVLRVLTGILVIVETLVWQGGNKKLISHDGWFGTDQYQKSRHRFSLLNYLPKTKYSLNAIFAVQLIAALFLLVGFGPNIAALVCFITLVSVHNRNIYVLSSGDTVYRFFCLFLIFAPLNTQLSLFDFYNFSNSEALGWPWVLIMFQLFMANIYLKNVLFKLLGECWRDGTATDKVLHVRIWNRFELPKVLDKNWFFKLTTYFTILVETAMFSLIWVEELRLPVLVAGVVLHLGLWIFLKFGFFQLTMIFGLTAFIKPEEFEWFFDWILEASK